MPDTIVETLPNLVTYILAGESNGAKEAVKEWIRNRQGSKIKASSIFKPFIDTNILWLISVNALSVDVTALLLYFFRKSIVEIIST